VVRSGTTAGGDLAAPAVIMASSVLLMASTNLRIGLYVLFRLLGRSRFDSSSTALIIVAAHGRTFNTNAENCV